MVTVLLGWHSSGPSLGSEHAFPSGADAAHTLYSIPVDCDLHTAVFFSLQSLCLMHTGRPTGVAVSHCITWFQTQQILSLCVRSATAVICGVIVALDSSEP